MLPDEVVIEEADVASGDHVSVVVLEHGVGSGKGCGGMARGSTEA